ncbi:hypothetical protein FQZ97_857340 [compost metagenome]
MEAEGNGHHVQRQHVAHAGLQGQHRTVRAGAHEVGHVVGVWRVEAAADGYPGEDQRHVARAAAHHALDGVELGDVGQLEVGLDALGRQTADVFLDPGRTGWDGHFLVGLEHHRVFQRGAANVGGGHLLADVHLVGVDGDGHLIRGRSQLGQHVAGVVGQPLGDVAVGFRGEGNRAADLEDHPRAGLTDTRQQFIELGQALGALAVFLTYVDVQDGRAGVVAVHGFLDLRAHADRDVFREIGRQPLRAIGRGGNDQLFHVFDKQRTIDEVHGLLLGSANQWLLCGSG